ncbi:MAG: Ig-like domain repeat protein, partial [Silvibacterium sp.]|nr:Ig-like domain repeat protein [Silvibacterium sp.]
MAMLPKNFFSLAPIFSFAAAFVFVSLTPAAAQTASPAASSLVTTRIVQPIDENSRVTLKGSVHPLANAANDRGSAPDSMPLERMTLFFKRSDAQEAALRQLIAGLHTPGSSSFHKWLTPDQFGKQFGPSDQDAATVQAWLSSHGFSVTKVNAGRQSIEFSGNVSQFRNTFHAQIHKYAVNGETHYANAADPQIPAALAPVIGGFAALNNFRIKSYARKLGTASYDPATGKTKPQWTISPAANEYKLVLSPGDFAVQYDLQPLYSAGTDGTGQTIAIVNDSNINIYLVNQFRSLFGLSANPPQVIIDGNDPGVDGINNPDGPNYDSDEAYLDVEWSGAVAPKATVDLVIGADTALESGLFLALEHAIYGNIAPVVSLSFGACESALGSSNVFLKNLYEQGAAQGQTILVSTGDSGSAACDDPSQYYAVKGQQVSGFASTPYNVAVGGTDFVYLNSSNQVDSSVVSNYWSLTASNSSPQTSILKVIPEQPWNDSQYGLNLNDYYQSTGQTTIAGGGGGASNAATCSASYDSSGSCTGTLAGYSKPSWQAGSGVPSDGVRDIPDVSLFAADGLNASFYPICYADGDCQSVSSGSTVQITGIGGTSASAPAFAGIMALVNQKYGPQGQAGFVLYPLAKQYPSAFHDVTSGTNSVPCSYTPSSLNCIAVTNAITVTDPGLGTATEGQIGTATTPKYNAGSGYDLASGLGSVDANVLISNWNKITFSSTTTTLTPSETIFAHGTSITINGSVTGTGTPTGSVALVTDSTEQVQQGQSVSQFLSGKPSTFVLSNGSFSGTVDYLPGGTYNIWGQYSGDGTNAASASQKTEVIVSPENSGIYFNLYSPFGTTSSGSVGSGATLDYGSQILLSAQVAPSSKLSAL